MELVAESLEGHALIDLANYNRFYNEGDTGKVSIFMDSDLTDEEIIDIENAIRSEGVVLTGPIQQDARMLVVPFRVAMWPLAVIGGIVATVGGVIGWQLFKDRVTSWLAAPFGVPIWVWILGAASVVALYFTRGKTGSAGQPVTQKFYLGKGAK